MIAGTPLIWVVMLAPLGLVFFFSVRLERMTNTSGLIPGRLAKGHQSYP